MSSYEVLYLKYANDFVQRICKNDAAALTRTFL